MTAKGASIAPAADRTAWPVPHGFVRPSGTEPKIKFYIEVKGEMGCPKCYTSADAEAEKKVEAVRKSLGI